MGFRLKILAALALVGVLPTLVVGALSYRSSREALRETIGALQVQTAQESARYCERFLLGEVESLRLSVGLLPFDELPPERYGEVLAIPLNQIRTIDALVLLDEHGSARTPPLLAHSAATSSPGRQSEPDLARLGRHIPLALALKTGTAVGPPYAATDGTPRVAVATRAAGTETGVVAAELSLEEFKHRMDELGSEGDAAYLVDAEGAPFTQSTSAPVLDPSERELVSSGLREGRAQVSLVTRSDGTQGLAAFAPLHQLGWGLLVEKPATEAFRSAARARTFTLYWAAIALVLTVVLGLILARGLSAPLAKLSGATRALAAGSFELALDTTRRDELGQLAVAFTQMAKEVERRDGEIRAWNAELHQRVEARTAELRQAQDQIARTRRLAALGSLSAGMAHELNNPLTSIIGLANLLKLELGQGAQVETLEAILEQSRRVARIIANLKQFADQERDAGGQALSLPASVDAVLEKHAEALNARGIEVVRQYAAGLPRVQGNPTQLQAAVGQLIQNAIQAMPSGGTLTLGIGALDHGALKLSVTDTGGGIPAEIRERIFDPFFTTKPAGAGVGLGLSVAHSIVEAHHGVLRVESSSTQGTEFTVILPLATSAHLA